MGILARCGLKSCEPLANGLLLNGSPTEAIEEVAVQQVVRCSVFPSPSDIRNTFEKMSFGAILRSWFLQARLRILTLDIIGDVHSIVASQSLVSHAIPTLRLIAPPHWSRYRMSYNSSSSTSQITEFIPILPRAGGEACSCGGSLRTVVEIESSQRVIKRARLADETSGAMRC